MNRRTFLKTTTSATAALAFAPPSHAAPKRDLRKAIMYSTIGVKGSVLDKFKAMKAAGFEGVEPLGAMNREEVIAALKETGLEAASVCDHIHWVKPLSAADEATRKLGYDGLIQSLQDARAYGATSVLLVPGSWMLMGARVRRMRNAGTARLWKSTKPFRLRATLA
jgi:hexulose-6-phosphate isomerase